MAEYEAKRKREAAEVSAKARVIREKEKAESKKRSDKAMDEAKTAAEKRKKDYDNRPSLQLPDISKTSSGHATSSKTSTTGETENMQAILSDAQAALWRGNFQSAKQLLDKAYRLDPKNERMIALSKEYGRKLHEKEDKEFNGPCP